MILQVAEERVALRRPPLKRRVAGPVRVVALADHDDVNRKHQPGMKLRARRPLHAVRWPLPSVRFEVSRDRRMPVAGRIHGYAERARSREVAVERRQDAVAVGCRKRPARTEIVLHINNEQPRIGTRLRHLRSSRGGSEKQPLPRESLWLRRWIPASVRSLAAAHPTFFSTEAIQSRRRERLACRQQTRTSEHSG